MRGAGFRRGAFPLGRAEPLAQRVRKILRFPQTPPRVRLAHGARPHLDEQQERRDGEKCGKRERDDEGRFGSKHAVSGFSANRLRLLPILSLPARKRKAGSE
jgi:hypothetical protein